MKTSAKKKNGVYDKTKSLKFLESARDTYNHILMDMLRAEKGAVYPLDLFMLGISKRSLALISGFSILISKNNFLAAAPLIRLHLDNVLQIYAMFLVEKPHDISISLMRGKKRMKDYKDKSGEPLTDGYLKNKFFSDQENKEFINLKEVYGETSKFIHFSEKHIFSTIQKTDKVKAISTFVVSDTLEIPEAEERSAIECMIQITRAQFKYLIGWAETKKLKSHEN